MIVLLAGCAAPGPVGADAHALLVLTPAEEVAVDPSTPEAQTHPTLARQGDGWLVAWDVGTGPRQRADLVVLDSDGRPAGPVEMLVSAEGAGFTTPDLVVGQDGDWHAVVRVADQVRVSRDGAEPVVVGEGDLGFWCAPDVARVRDGLVVGWWDGAMDGPADYVVARVALDGSALDPPEVEADAAVVGSPIAIEPLPDGGWVLAWSDGEGIRARVVDADGEEVVSARVDDVELPMAPSRPALAVGQDALVVGWRAQDDAQRGYGTRLRWYGLDLMPKGASRAVGLAPESTNRIELATDGERVAAVWEEDTADGDVVVQVFDLASAEAHTGPIRVHDVLDGRQARPTVELVETASGAEVAVAFESGPPGSASQVRVRRFLLSGG